MNTINQDISARNAVIAQSYEEKHAAFIAANADNHLSFDRAEWVKHYATTPLACPAGWQNVAAMHAGVCVKTLARENGGAGLPSLCGRVAFNGMQGGKVEDAAATPQCVVVGHGWMEHPSEIFVWKGTYQEFLSTWEVD